MIYRFSTERYVFEKEESSVRSSDKLYATCYAFTITARDTQQLIRKATYLLEHTSEYTSLDCISKNYSSLDDLLEMSASEYFIYINFVSQNSLNDPHYESVVSAEEDDFCSIFKQGNKKKR